MELWNAKGEKVEIGFQDAGTHTEPFTVAVGENGDFKSLNEAIRAASLKYPAYAAGGLPVNVKILAGTTVDEQVTVVGADFSYIKIIAEDSVVPVDVSDFTSQGLNSHDLRENDAAFFGGENGAGLPTIGCKFKVAANSKSKKVVGYFANRSSKGVILANCGFIGNRGEEGPMGFRDGAISNNESSVTIREGIARSMERWGVHARHNGEVSARSAKLTNCGECAAYADRVANLDVREADLSESKQAVFAANASMICATGAHCKNGGKGSAGSLVYATSASTISAGTMEIKDPKSKNVFGVLYGGTIEVHSLDFTNSNGISVFSKPRNAMTVHGIIYSDKTYTETA